MADANHQRIQERAYQIWLREGCPHGRDLDHWNRAEQEVSKEYHSAGAQAQGQSQPRPTEAVHGADSQPRPQSQPKQPAGSGSSRGDGAAPSHVDSPSGATPAAAGADDAGKKRTRGKLKEDPGAKTEGKPSKKQAGERAVREPPRK